jgi:multiple sugar transport system substrate-binding protein
LAERFETENILFGALITMFLVITVVMGTLLYSEPSYPPGKTLKILIPADTQYVDRQRMLDEEYRKIHPDMQVRMIPFPWETIWQKLEFMMVAGIPPDVSGMQQPNLPKFVEAGEVEPLDDWMRNDPQFDASGILPECMDECSWDDKLWALPESFSTVCLWYNKSLFDEARVPYPNRDWTQEDLVAAAKKLTRDTDGDGVPNDWGFFTDNNHWNRYPAWIWQRGGEFVTSDLSRVTFDDPNVIAGIRWLAGLGLKERIMPTGVVMGTFSATNLFISGHLAMTTQTRYFLTNFFQDKNTYKVRSFEWDVSELPHEQNRATTFVLDLDIIPASLPEERKKMAWDYLRFLITGPGQEIIAEGNTALPVLRTLAEKTVNHPGMAPEHDRAFLDSISYARYLYRPFPAEEAALAARSELQGVWDGDLDAGEVCREASINMNAAVADFLRKHPGAHLPVKTKWTATHGRQAEAAGSTDAAAAAAP